MICKKCMEIHGSNIVSIEWDYKGKAIRAECTQCNAILLPKKKPQTFEFWVNVYEDGRKMIFDIETIANTALLHDGIKRLGPAEKITITREVE